MAQPRPDFADQLPPAATMLTVRPREVDVPAPVSAALPRAAVGLASDASSEATAVFVERAQGEAPQDQAAPAEAEAYDVVASIGKGGMGEVWRAKQRSLGREVALKQLIAPGQKALAHFLSEARVTARLGHANIVPVHTLGRSADGRPMLAMKLVEGKSWHEQLHYTEPPRPLEEHLSIFISVCNAIAFAHDEGFIHRDLKPANVMVGDYGQVFVVDWGIAVGLDRATCERHGILHVEDVRSPAGTPAYMAPELVLADGSLQGPATDIFLLGACLYEVLVGRPPHQRPTAREAVIAAAECAPPELPEEVPRELADACIRAMSREPADRYDSVGELRAAVEAYLSHSAARTITKKGLVALERLKERVGQFAGLAEADKAEAERGIHSAYDEAHFAFDTALETWPDDEDALRGGAAAARTMLEHALATEDLATAARISAELEDEELRARTEALRERLDARRDELASLRERVELLDDSRIARPLGQLFIVAGVAGAVVTLPTRWIVDSGGTSSFIATASVWGTIAVGSGAYAIHLLRRAGKSLVSSRIGWTWATVGASCLSCGIIATAQHVAPFENAAYPMLMIAIGFVAMAMQTRRWLVIPAIVTAIGSMALAFAPTLRVEIFGATWFVTLTGVGAALRRVEHTP